MKSLRLSWPALAVVTLGGIAPGGASAAEPQGAKNPWLESRFSLLDQAEPVRALSDLPEGPRGLRDAGLEPIRGMTLGPIESTIQPERGYGSQRFYETLGEAKRLGANWISLTAFGRVWDLKSAGVDPCFERPAEEIREAIGRSVDMAHARGLRVLLVPHLWLESGEWRAELQPGDDARFERWVRSYSKFVLSWADVAEQSGVDLFAAGVELRSWVTSSRATSFVDLIHKVRARYSGLVTYAANWDDVEDTVVLGQLDLIGINAFYPLHWEDDATWQQVEAGGHRVAEGIAQLAARYERPVVFTEFGYTTRKDTEIKPWLWPEQLGQVEVNQWSQARAYAALLGAMRQVPGFAGAFVWRMYADVADMSQEAEWGFSPWGKEAQQVLEDTFADSRFGDPPWFAKTN